MQACVKFLLAFIIIFQLLVSDAAADFDIKNELLQKETLFEGLSEEEKELLGDITDDGGFDAEGALRRIASSTLSKLRKNIQKQYMMCVSAFALSLCAFLASVICEDKRFDLYINLLACAGIAVILLGVDNSIYSETIDTLYRLSDYSRAALPVICTAAAAGGAVTSSAAKYSVCCLGLDVIITAANRLILPMINAYLAFSVSSAVCDNALLTALSRFFKWGSITLMSVITLAFTVYLSFTGIIAGSTDALAVKTAKTVISTVLPVVGGMISDCAGTILSAASIIRNTAGIFSLTAVCAVCAVPFLTAAVRMLLIKMTAALSDFSSGLKTSQLMSAIAAASGMLAGLTGACAIIVFISFTSMIKAVV